MLNHLIVHQIIIIYYYINMHIRNFDTLLKYGGNENCV